MEQQQTGVLTSKTIQRINATHTFQNVTLINEVTRSARLQHQAMHRQQQQQESSSGLVLGSSFVAYEGREDCEAGKEVFAHNLH